MVSSLVLEKSLAFSGRLFLYSWVSQFIHVNEQNLETSLNNLRNYSGGEEGADSFTSKVIAI